MTYKITLLGNTETGTTWANEMNFWMNYALNTGSINNLSICSPVHTTVLRLPQKSNY